MFLDFKEFQQRLSIVLFFSAIAGYLLGATWGTLVAHTSFSFSVLRYG